MNNLVISVFLRKFADIFASQGAPPYQQHGSKFSTDVNDAGSVTSIKDTGEK
jgi:hypothetical protein